MERSEGYFFRNSLYSCRRDFFSRADISTIKPDFLSSTPKVGDGPVQPLQISITGFLNRIQNELPLYILYSGGIDSEIVLLSALKAGLAVKPVIVDLFGMNAYEMMFAKNFLQDYGIRDFVRVEITEDEFQKKWLPELISDTESLSYLLAGAYIAARSCPPKARVIQSGENPNVLYFKSGSLFQMRHEYSFWTAKLRKKRDVDIYDVYSDDQVLRSYLRYGPIFERLNSGVPYDEWSCDNEYLGKEYLYNDPDFKNLKRRYSQHGWEARKGAKGYTKDMIPFLNPYSEAGNKKSKPYITDEMALPYLLDSLEMENCDPEMGYRMIFKGEKSPHASSLESIRSKDFNGVFYSYLGRLTGSSMIRDVDRSVITSHQGELLSVF